MAAPNQSLKTRTECDDGIQDLDDIKTVVNNIISSLSIVKCEYKNNEVTSQQCEYKNGKVTSSQSLKAFGATINGLDDTTCLQHCCHNNECNDTAFQLQAASKIFNG